MRVDRVMTLLYGDNKYVGYIKAEQIGENVTLYADTSILGCDKCICVVKLGECMHVVLLDKLSRNYTIHADSDKLSHISCVIIDSISERIVAEGSDSNCIDVGEYMRVYEHYKSQNSNTYIGVKSHIYDENAYEDIESNVDNVSQEIIRKEPTQSETIEEVESSVDTPIDTKDSVVIEPSDEAVYDDKTPFYDAISTQLENLFTRYEHEKALEDMITSSRFARIYYEDDKYYVVGVVEGENKKPELICYGYPSSESDEPPKEVEGSYEWLPMSRDNTSHDGYYMMYQNAVTGDIIEN